ncbi:MAG: hypothetical protein LBI42_04440 [Chitinispirillales bacterium]|jgi:hypothetical protein|nr:hypothetical protein [Chitinispirillales bacterium]
MRKLIVFAFFAVGMVGGGYPQEIPKELMRLVENNVKDTDPNARYGFLRAKRAGFIKGSIDSIHIQDLRVRVLQMYRFKHVFLEAYPDSVDFGKIIEPSGYWRVLVMAQRKPLYEVYLRDSLKVPVFAGMASLPSNGSHIWDPLLKDYPESTRVNPVLFSKSGVPFFNRDDFFLYFKHKNSRKIRYLKDRFGDQSLETLDDSKELIRYWKKQGLNEVGRRGVNRAKTEGEK